MRWMVPFWTASMGWTDDKDTEGLVEENPLVFLFIGLIGAAVVTILYFVGIEYQPGWFEGQNLISSLGIIFLLIFVPAIAISTMTGKSDLAKWEAIFLFISVFLIFLGNNGNFIDALSAKIGSWMGVDWDVKDMLTIVLIATIIITAISASMGKGISVGSALIFIICIVGIWAINAGLTWEDFFSKLGTAFNKATSGIIGTDIGAAIGVGLLGAAAGAMLGSVVPGLGTAVGAAIGFFLAAGGFIYLTNPPI